MKTQPLVWLSFPFALAACHVGAPASTTVQPKAPEAAPEPIPVTAEGSACAGKISAPKEAKLVEDAELAKSSLGEPGKGRLCSTLTFEATAPIKVYRVWNSQKAYSQFGQWWTFEKPVGPVDQYREFNGICPEWSALDRVTACEIKVGARFAVGTGQSVDCEGGVVFATSPVNQVFIPNDTRRDRWYLDHCEELGTFP
jgi:hypothetical protein